MTLLVLEGPDGVGKTTLSHRLAEQWAAAGGGGPVERLSFPGRAEGTLGRLVYDLHHDPAAHGVEALAPASLQALHVAAHLDAIERRIRPLLAAGTRVVLDRFWWSTLLYGRQAGVPEATLRALIDAERLHWRDVRPALLVVVDRPAPFDAPPEGTSEAWHSLRNAYRAFAREEAHPYPVHVLDHTGPAEDAAREVLDVLARV